jgi:hypothetical protein
MADPLRHRLTAGALLWAATGLLLAFFDRPLWDWIWILTLGLWALFALVGLVLFGLSFRAGIRQRWPRVLVATAAGLPLAAAALWFAHTPLARAGDEFQFRRRFQALRPEYVRIAAQLVAHRRPPQRGEVRGISFLVDTGPPVRIAFPQPGGILDNWEGVVYDPTDAVRTATGWRDGTPGNYSASPEAVNLFGGALVACKPLPEHFYRCWFT